MATTTVGYSGTLNDFMFDASMHWAWTQGYSITGLGRMIQTNTVCAAASGGGTGGAAAWLSGSTNSTLYVTTDSMAAGSGASGVTHTVGFDQPSSSLDSWSFGFNASKGVWVPYHDDGGTTAVKVDGSSNNSGGTNVNAYTGRTGSMSAFGTYFILATYVRRGGAWVQAFFKVRRSGVWTFPQTFVRRSGVWIQVRHLGANIEFDPSKEFQIMRKGEDGTWEGGIMKWEGPYYIGNKPEIVTPRIYELVAA